MSKTIRIPKYEQTILDIGGMKPEELEILINCIRIRLAQLKPRVRAPRKQKAGFVQEKAL